jgi:hypothetical protein
MAANDTISAAENVARLYDAWAQLEKFNKQVIAKGVELTDDEWSELLANTYAARDAYYHGLGSFVDTADPHVKFISTQVDATREELANLKTSQANVEKALTLVSQLAGLAGKLLALAAV